jgi:hypothetical protein
MAPHKERNFASYMSGSHGFLPPTQVAEWFTKLGSEWAAFILPTSEIQLPGKKALSARIQRAQIAIFIPLKKQPCGF